MEKIGNSRREMRRSQVLAIWSAASKMSKIFGVVVFSALILFCTGSWAQKVTVRATVNQNEIEVGDQIDYTVTVSATDMVANVGKPRLPDIEGFKLVGQRPEVIAQNFMINGTIQSTTTQNFHFFFEAERKGNFKIAPSEIMVQGKTYTTNEIKVSVVAGGGGRKKQRQREDADPFNDPFFDEDDQIYSQLLKRQRMMDPRFRGQDEDAFGARPRPSKPLNAQEAFSLDVEVDKKEAYVGEQVTVSYYIYSKNLVRDIDPLKYPDLKAFWKEDIAVPQRLDFEDVVVNGVAFKRALLASYAIFPIKPGSALIDPYKAKCSVMALQNGGAFFGLSPTVQFTKSSPEVHINVKPLPAQNVPRSFSGAVGEFKISSSVPAQKLVSGQPFALKIRIEGRGNAKNIDLPPLDLPSTLEQYDSKNESKFYKDGKSYKEFELLLIPRQTGTIKIPAIAIAVFDPKLKRYVEQSTDPITLTIGAGTGTDAVKNQPLENEKVKEGTELPSISLEWHSTFPISREQRIWGWGILYLLSAIFLALKAWRELGLGQRRLGFKKRFEQRLLLLKQEASKGNFRSVGAKGVNLISFVVGEVAGDEGSYVSLEKMLSRVPPSLRRELEMQIKEQQSTFEALSFAPESTLGTLKEQSHLVERVRGLEKVMDRAINLSGVDGTDSSLKDSTTV